MTPFGWIRPIARDFWGLAPDAGKVLRFMSVQANLMGASVVATLLGFGFGHGWVFLALGAWVLLAAYGAVVKQPELEDDDAAGI